MGFCFDGEAREVSALGNGASIVDQLGGSSSINLSLQTVVDKFTVILGLTVTIV